MRFPVFIIFCYKQTSPLEVPKYVFGFGLFILPQFSPPTVEDVKKVQTAKRKYDRIANEGNRFAISFFKFFLLQTNFTSRGATAQLRTQFVCSESFFTIFGGGENRTDRKRQVF